MLIYPISLKHHKLKITFFAHQIVIVLMSKKSIASVCLKLSPLFVLFTRKLKEKAQCFIVDYFEMNTHL